MAFKGYQRVPALKYFRDPGPLVFSRLSVNTVFVRRGNTIKHLGVCALKPSFGPRTPQGEVSSVPS